MASRPSWRKDACSSRSAPSARFACSSRRRDGAAAGARASPSCTPARASAASRCARRRPPSRSSRRVSRRASTVRRARSRSTTRRGRTRAGARRRADARSSRPRSSARRHYHAEQRFDWATDEGLYGLGAQQSGLVNYRGHDVLLVQDEHDRRRAGARLVARLRHPVGQRLGNPPARRAPRPLGRAAARPSGSLWSQMAEAIDYTFLYGPDLDDVVASYRRLTASRTALRPLGLRLLAVQGALQDAGGAGRRRARVPPPADPDGRDRAGLVLLGPLQVGLAPVRPRALPRPRGA